MNFCRKRLFRGEMGEFFLQAVELHTKGRASFPPAFLFFLFFFFSFFPPSICSAGPQEAHEHTELPTEVVT